MAKKKKLTKEEVKGPDAFQSAADQVSKFLSENWKPMAAVISVVVAGSLGMVVKQSLDKAAEESAQVQIYPAIKQLGEVQQKISELENPLPEFGEDGKPVSKKTPEVDKAKVAELEKELGEKANQLEKLISENSGTTSAEIATLNLTGFYIAKEQYDKAKPILERILPETQKGTTNYGIVRSQLASVLSYTGDSKQASMLLQEIVDDTSLVYFHGDALVKLGVLHYENKDFEKAKVSLLRAKTEFASFTSGKIAAQYLRWLDYVQPSQSGDEVSQAQ
ncbi:MAG: tetratricopeptide repeat protein [Bdellovibrionales bacterium]|nr:tetratricopeptide repeat protein [Bdellovibrionales bacterium]